MMIFSPKLGNQPCPCSYPIFCDVVFFLNFALCKNENQGKSKFCRNLMVSRRNLSCFGRNFSILHQNGMLRHSLATLEGE